MNDDVSMEDATSGASPQSDGTFQYTIKDISPPADVNWRAPTQADALTDPRLRFKSWLEGGKNEGPEFDLTGVLPYDDNRQAYHPIVRLYTGLPLHPLALTLGKGNVSTAVVEFDPRVGLRDQKFQSTLPIPPPERRYLAYWGYHRQLPNVLYVARNILTDMQAKDDIFVSYIESAAVIKELYPTEVQTVNEVAFKMLGPRKGRVGAQMGGVAFEKMRPLKMNDQHGRTYTCGPSTQTPKGNLKTPSSNMRYTNKDERQTIELRTEMNSAFVHLSSNVLGRRDPDWVTHMGNHAQVTNAHPFGHVSNKGFSTTSQVNFSGVEKQATLQDSLGTAGGAHTDAGDAASSLSVLIPCGDLPACDPGALCFPQLGMYVDLERLSVICFSGLRLHGSIPPRPFTDEDYHPYLTRVNFIAYANAGALERTAPLLLASHASSSIEVCATRVDDILARGVPISQTTNLSFAKDGHNLIDDKTKAFNYLVRDLLFLAKDVLNQSGVRAEILPDEWVKAFRMVNPAYIEPTGPTTSASSTGSSDSSMSEPTTPPSTSSNHEQETPPSGGNLLTEQQSTSSGAAAATPPVEVPKYLQAEQWLLAPGPSSLTNKRREEIIAEAMDRSFKVRLSIPSQLQDSATSDPTMFRYFNGVGRLPDLDPDWVKPVSSMNIPTEGGSVGTSGLGVASRTRAATSSMQTSASSAASTSSAYNTRSHNKVSNNGADEGGIGVQGQEQGKGNDSINPTDTLKAISKSKKNRPTQHNFFGALRGHEIPSLSKVRKISASETAATLSLSHNQTDVVVALTAEIDSANALMNISRHWNAVLASTSACLHFAALENVLHARIMACHLSLWQWLCSEVRPLILHHQSPLCIQHSEDAAWLKPLISRVTNVYCVAGSNSSVLLSFSKIFGVPSNQSDFEDEAYISRLGHLADGQLLFDLVADRCVYVIAQWLRLQPNMAIKTSKTGKAAKGTRSDLWHVRGQLLQSLADLNCAGLFALPCVFKAFQNPIPYVYSTKEESVHTPRVASALVTTYLLKKPDKRQSLVKLSKDLLLAAPELRDVLSNDLPPEEEEEDLQEDADKDGQEKHDNSDSSSDDEDEDEQEQGGKGKGRKDQHDSDGPAEDELDGDGDYVPSSSQKRLRSSSPPPRTQQKRMRVQTQTGDQGSCAEGELDADDRTASNGQKQRQKSTSTHRVRKTKKRVPVPAKTNNYQVACADTVAMLCARYMARVALPGNGSQNLTLAWINDNNDKRYPLREGSTSRAAFLAELHSRVTMPLKDYFRSPVGCLMLITYRGLFHNGPYLLNGGRLIFDDILQLKAAMAPLTDNQIRDRNAYGRQALHYRSKANLDGFYTSAQSFSEFCMDENNLKDGLPVFRKVWSFFKKKENKLWSMGDLQLLLLLGDLALAGAVNMPDDEFVAQRSLKMATGPYRLLKRLNLLPSDQACSPENVQLYVDLYHAARDHLKRFQLIHLLPDIIHFEHLLCKVLRALDDGASGILAADPAIDAVLGAIQVAASKVVTFV